MWNYKFDIYGANVVTLLKLDFRLRGGMVSPVRSLFAYMYRGASVALTVGAHQTHQPSAADPHATQVSQMVRSEPQASKRRGGG